MMPDLEDSIVSMASGGDVGRLQALLSNDHELLLTKTVQDLLEEADKASKPRCPELPAGTAPSCPSERGHRPRVDLYTLSSRLRRPANS